MNTILLVISFLSLTIYLIWFKIKYGKTESISATVEKISTPWLFTAMWCLYAIPLALVANTPLMYVGSMFLVAVAFQPAKNPATNLSYSEHVDATYLAIISLCAALIFHYHLWWVAVIGGAFSAFSMWKAKLITQHTYWDECVFAYSALIVIFCDKIIHIL